MIYHKMNSHIILSHVKKQKMISIPKAAPSQFLLPIALFLSNRYLYHHLLVPLYHLSVHPKHYASMYFFTLYKWNQTGSVLLCQISFINIILV